MKYRVVLVLACSLLVPFNLAAQETKKVTTKSEVPNTKEVFYVLKGSPAIKQGPYTREFFRMNALSFVEKGQYENGVRSGVWEVLDADGNLNQKIDFTTQTVEFSRTYPKHFISRSMLPESGSWKENTSGNLPEFLGGVLKFHYYIYSYLRYPKPARVNGKSGTVVVSAVITTEGKIIEEKVEEGFGFGCDEESLRVIKLLPDEWIPLRMNGVFVNTKVFFDIKFKMVE